MNFGIQTNRVKRRAFTLMELLVVVAIIAILASLLMPALTRGKQNAQRINCLSNLRQMAIAAQIYVDDQSGSYPVAYYEEVRQGVKYSVAWDLTTALSSTPSVAPGLLWQGAGSEKIQQCPSFRGKANWLVDPHTGYNYNTSYLGHGENESVPEPAKAADVKKPSGTIIFGDGEYGAGANKFMRAPWPSLGDQSFRGRWAGTQGYRHTRKTNALFCDGHAESLKNRFTENKDGLDRVAPGTGFISADNELYDLE
jgi:prepilin-type N-terminal cleavage/methylation domain-containing protein/prepilin-type processing-associated H-X9-DG protein